MTAHLSLEERLCGLIARSEDLAAGFMQLDLDLRQLAQDLPAELEALRRQAMAEERLGAEVDPTRRRLTAVPPSLNKDRRHG